MNYLSLSADKLAYGSPIWKACEGLNAQSTRVEAPDAPFAEQCSSTSRLIRLMILHLLCICTRWHSLQYLRSAVLGEHNTIQLQSFIDSRGFSHSLRSDSVTSPRVIQTIVQDKKGHRISSYTFFCLQTCWIAHKAPQRFRLLQSREHNEQVSTPMLVSVQCQSYSRWAAQNSNACLGLNVRSTAAGQPGGTAPKLARQLMEALEPLQHI
jgi:hypothetical protein